MYEGLISELRHYFDGVPLVMQAADAIEELSKIREEQKAQIILMAAEIEELKNYAELYQDLTEKNQQTARKLLDAYPRWISVEEALPEKDGDYLVNCNGVVHESNFSILREAHWLDPVEEWEKYEDVTHWMPLPEPPKEET